MTNNCDVCDKQFESEDALLKHVDEHLSASIINKPIEISNDIANSFSLKKRSIKLKNIFSEKKFKKLVENKINQIEDIDETLAKQNFIKQIQKITQKNPFCYVPYFAKDFMLGLSNRELENKYHIWFWMDLYNITHNILEFSEDRYTSRKYDNALELNLKIIHWNKKYKELIDCSKFFKTELDVLFFDNILQAKIIFSLMDNKLEKDEIIVECKELKNQYDLFHFIDKNLVDSFNEILETNLENRVENILLGLKEEKIIVRSILDPKKLTIDLSINKIKNNIIRELKIKEKIVYATLRTAIIEQFPALKLIPKFGVFDTAWTELEKEGAIHIEYRSSKRNDFVIFLNEDYLKIQKKIQSIGTNNLTIPFKGRKITPERFIEELLELDRGDFDDADDQVTRLAGLVLAESVKLQSTHEDIPEFDFSINLKNYDFRPEQNKAIEKLDFKINSEIFHVKVMIDEILNLKKYHELKEKVPNHEQAVVITFEKIPPNVKKLLNTDPTIQIIDEEGVKIWVSITSCLPARVNSLCKITLDPLSKLENKLVKVNSIFYETGIAIVSVIPEMNEETVLARSLEEIPLFEPEPSNFETYSKNYLEFLKILSVLTTNENLIKGFCENEFTENQKTLKLNFEFKFKDNIVRFDFIEYDKKSIFNCDCMQWKENPMYLCSHLVSALDHTVRMNSFLDKSWGNDQNHLRNSLVSVMRENIPIILDKLGVYYDENESPDQLKIADFIFGISKIKENN